MRAIVRCVKVRIPGDRVGGPFQVYSDQMEKTRPKVNNEKSPESGGPRDRVTISSLGREIQKARQALDQVPEVRQAKVDEIKERIRLGTYNVTGKEVARKLVEGEK